MGFRVDIEHIEDYKFTVKFDKESLGNLTTDEGKEIGGDEEGPDPSRLLGTAALNCLMASLVFCLEKKRITLESFKGSVEGTVEKVNGRSRVTGMEVSLKPKVQEDDIKKLEGCVKIFEDYCVVTQSIRNGIDVKVSVEPEI